jgi:hypothetical protein
LRAQNVTNGNFMNQAGDLDLHPEDRSQYGTDRHCDLAAGERAGVTGTGCWRALVPGAVTGHAADDCRLGRVAERQP